MSSNCKPETESTNSCKAALRQGKLSNCSAAQSSKRIMTCTWITRRCWMKSAVLGRSLLKTSRSAWPKSPSRSMTWRIRERKSLSVIKRYVNRFKMKLLHIGHMKRNTRPVKVSNLRSNFYSMVKFINNVLTAVGGKFYPLVGLRKRLRRKRLSLRSPPFRTLLASSWLNTSTGSKYHPNILK